MKEIDFALIRQEKMSTNSLFPLENKLVEKFFKKKYLKDAPVYNYGDILSDRIFEIEEKNPDLFEEICINADNFRARYLRAGQRNLFVTGAYIMHEIFAQHARYRNFEMPVLNLEDFKATSRINPKKQSTDVSIEDFLFLGKQTPKMDRYEQVKRRQVLDSIVLLANEQPTLLGKLRVPDNPSMLVGAAYVYDKFHRKVQS